MTTRKKLRHLVLVLGDQLDTSSAAFDGFDATRDAVWMAETHQEATHVWCHKRRLAFFFTAMRHFRDELRHRDIHVHYHALTADPAHDRGQNFTEILQQDIPQHTPEKLIVIQPGDLRVTTMLQSATDQLNLPLEIRPDRHFYCSTEAFNEYADGRKTLVLEFFYRHMRKKHHLLIDSRGKPTGGEWNFDKANRETFGKKGPGLMPPLQTFTPDKLTRDVIAMVNTRFADHPGSTDDFDLPVTHTHAQAALDDFIKHRLADFGTYEDAMWTDQPLLHHSRLSAVLNAHLLDPRDCIAAAVNAYENGHAPINSVEGFVRQILGWREFVRGIYFRFMPAYAEMNALGCDDRDVPAFFWTGQTHMRCVRESMTTLLAHGYTHHIHRLMVLGLFSLLAGVHPKRFHDWHMAMYLDAIDWASLPNTLGMSQFGDGGIVGTKPYCATGQYIQRMSNFCSSCQYNPKQATGEKACPFTTLYWDLLARHQTQFQNLRRMQFQLRNLERKTDQDLNTIREHAARLKQKLDQGETI